MARADSTADGAAAQAGGQVRIWTVPNAISMARLAGVPVFLWLVLGPRTATADYWAVALLIAAGISDWLDGKIARAWNQQSRLGQVLDPAADRLYIAATVVGLAVRGIIPWWLVGLLVAREVVLGPQADGWAVALLIVAGLSDWLDGVIARAWNQQSRLGQVLDPAADRLYIAATLIGLAVRAIIPWWLVAVLVARELVLGVALLVLRRHGHGPLQVSLVGKTATLCLLYAFPLLFLGSHAGTAALVARVVGWAFAIWGTALYWWAAALYLEQTARLAGVTVE